MLLPTAIATQLAADSVAGRRGAATSSRSAFSLPHPVAAFRARCAAATPCVAC